MSGQYF
jgi:hypothetical protein